MSMWVNNIFQIPKDIPKDIMSLEGVLLLEQGFPRTFPRTLCPSEMKQNAWTNAWTKCPCSKY